MRGRYCRPPPPYPDPLAFHVEQEINILRNPLKAATNTLPANFGWPCVEGDGISSPSYNWLTQVSERKLEPKRNTDPTWSNVCVGFRPGLDSNQARYSVIHGKIRLLHVTRQG